eukprot:13811688-Ditylum_brightwellii.AAC.1
MACNTSSVDGQTPQPDLPISLKKILNQATTANLLEHLRDQLQQRNCICGVAPGASIVMHMGHFTRTTPNIPTNFTTFVLPQRKADTLDVVGLAVKAAKGKGLE